MPEETTSDEERTNTTIRLDATHDSPELNDALNDPDTDTVFSEPVNAGKLAPGAGTQHPDPPVTYGVVDTSRRAAPATQHEFEPLAEFEDRGDETTHMQHVVPFRVIVRDADSRDQARAAKQIILDNHDHFFEDALIVVPLSDTRGI